MPSKFWRFSSKRGDELIEHNDIFINGAWDASSASAVPAIVNPVAEEVIAHISRIVGDVDRSSKAVSTSMTAASTANSSFRTSA
jgi:hypothetical protein